MQNIILNAICVIIILHLYDKKNKIYIPKAIEYDTLKINITSSISYFILFYKYFFQ